MKFPPNLGKLPKAAILNRLGLLPFFNFHETLSLNGEKTLRIPIAGKTGLNHRYPHEEWLDILLSHLVSQHNRNTVIDAGVNLGQTTLKLLRLGFPGPYVGFEPNPVCASFVTSLLAMNEIDGYRIVPLGLANRNGVADLYASADKHDPSATIIKGFRNDQTKRPLLIGLCRLDDVAEQIGLQNVGIIKIDVEGAELDLIEGGVETISRYRPHIICEILPIYCAEENQDRLKRQTKIMSIMRELRYRIYRIDHESARLDELSQIEVHSDLERCDYLFAPR